MIDGYKGFVDGFTDGGYQYERLKGYFDLLDEGRFVAIDAKGFGNLGLFLKMIVKNRSAMWQMTQRLARFASRPRNIYFALRGLGLTLRRRRIKGGFGYFQFWFFAWTNAVLKYQNISDSDFDIESVEPGFDIRKILPVDYQETADEDIPEGKTKAQLRATIQQLETIVASRT